MMPQGDAGPLRTQSAFGRVAVITTSGLGLLTLFFGAWALAFPRSFFETVATFEPYNRHFVHDAGAFSIGVAAALLLAAWGCSGLVVALGGFLVAETLHVLSHLLDRDLGGRPWLDISFLAAQCLVALVVLVRARSRTTADDG